MNYSVILGCILDIGAGLIRSGAETHRVEDSLYRLCGAYHFENCNIWVVPSNIQATVTDPDGKTETQIRHIRRVGMNFDRLDRLNDLSRRCCSSPPNETELAAELQKAMNTAPSKLWISAFAALMAGVSFGVFFNCDSSDALVAAFASLLITVLGRFFGRRESNPLILNFIIASLAEFFILLCVHFGFGHHTGYITVGVVMLLISALGTTNGVRDLVHLDTLSGVMNISASFTGAVGIALGIALPLIVLPGYGTNEPLALNPSVPAALISCVTGCAGFAVWFHTKKIPHVLTCAFGAAVIWGVYLATAALTGDIYCAALIASVACSLLAMLMARVNKAPVTIFRTICIFPLIPGASLYYMMYGIIMRDGSLASSMGLSLFLTCFCIVLGFLAVEAVSGFFKKVHSSNLEQ